MLLLPHYTPGQMFRVISQDDVCGFADHWESLYGFPRASSEHGSAFIPWEDSIPCVSWEGSLLSHMLAGGQPQWAPPDKVKLWGSSLLPPQEFPARELTLGAGSSECEGNSDYGQLEGSFPGSKAGGIPTPVTGTTECHQLLSMRNPESGSLERLTFTKENGG